MNIIYAYCEEIDEVVTIDTARRYFLSEDPRLGTYHFFCAAPACRENKIRISGVNYKNLAEDGAKFRAPHYRQWDEHHQNCEWQVDEETGKVEGESDEDARLRKSRRKVSDLVNIFDPTLEEEKKKGGITTTGVFKNLEGGVDGFTKSHTSTGSSNPGDIKTNSLERLVDTYIEAKKILSEEEFKTHEIRIVREGRIRLKNYFCRVQYASHYTENRVLFGNATLWKRYGTGFSFSFFDKINDARVNLYISKEMMGGYRFRKYIEMTLDKHSDVKYFTLYAIGRLVASPKSGMDLIVEDLRHLVIRTGPPKDIPST